MPINYTQVVVGVLYNQSKQFLLSKRPVNKPHAGYWEFAGGKVELLETKTKALQRELNEELGIYVAESNMQFIFKHCHSYEHLHVELYFYTINTWHGEVKPIEQQELSWVSIDNFPSPLLPSLSYIIPTLNKFNFM